MSDKTIEDRARLALAGKVPFEVAYLVEGYSLSGMDPWDLAMGCFEAGERESAGNAEKLASELDRALAQEDENRRQWGIWQARAETAEQLIAELRRVLPAELAEAMVDYPSNLDGSALLDYARLLRAAVEGGMVRG